jgi:peptidoglycan/xylan/chitin deacetylase (PgdA/CDA1 family)
MIDRNRRIISSFAPLAGLETLVKYSRQNVIFPFYHDVSDQPLAHVSHLYPLRTEGEFKQDLEEMLRWFEPIGLGDFMGGKTLVEGKRYMVLTFDDGLAGCHQVIAPLLREKGIPAAFFLNNHFIDNRGLFYRYKSSLLIERIRTNDEALKRVAEYLSIPQGRVEESVHLIREDQISLLDVLMDEAEVDVDLYLKDKPVYLSTKQVVELVQWGFDIGGHSPSHADFSKLKPKEIISQVNASIGDLQHRFQVSTRYFSFPFTSWGIPGELIDELLEKGYAEVLMGTAGLKKRDKPGFIQRIPMEEFRGTAVKALKTEYLYYLLKGLVGRNRLSS